MSALRFTIADVDRAHAQWGCNCGPGAIAAVLGLTLDELRPHMGDFERKGYTNPTLMWDVLTRLGVTWRLTKPPVSWPRFGLVRVQWEGPWTAPGLPPRVAYRYTHWIGAQLDPGRRSDAGIFDINCLNSGGWISERGWSSVIVPHLLQSYPNASGRWHRTHVVEIDRASIRPIASIAPLQGSLL